MTDFHHAALDDHPDDSSCRLLLGEYLAERGDPDAAGYRWMAGADEYPFEFAFGWRFVCLGSKMIDADRGDGGITRLMLKANSNSFMYRTRRAAELALCRAVAEMQKEAET